MTSRRRDKARLATLALLLVPAAYAGRNLRVDVENLAMKSVGTATQEAARIRAEEFGDEPRLVLLAEPRAPELLAPIDVAEAERWIDGLRAHEDVVEVEELPTQRAGEHLLGLEVRTDEGGRYADAVRSVQRMARRTLPPTYRLAVAGYPVVEVAIAEAIDAERARILPIVIGTLGLFLLAIYRSPVLALGALLAPLSGVLLLEGLQGALGLAIDPVSALLGPAVLSVGVASSVHVLESYLRSISNDGDVVSATHEAARRLRVPFTLAIATTVTGFLGLLASPIPAVRRFGLLAAVGVMLTIGTTFLCLPSLLRLFHRPRPGQRPITSRHLVRHVARLRSLSAPLVATAGLLVVAGLALAPRTRIDDDPLHVLPAGDVVRRDAEVFGARLGGNAVFELLLPPSGPRDPLSLASLVARVTAIDGVVGPAGVPLRAESGYALAPFLLSSDAHGEEDAVFTAAEAVAAGAGWEGAAATGLAVQVERDSQALVIGQRRGIVLTLLGLWAVMALGFRSVTLGLVGLVPNILPVVAIYGAMAALDQPLTVATSMIGVVMLGLVVDDTIHLLHVYRTSVGTPVRRMARTFAHVRRPVVITSVVLCLGFAASLFGELEATREFGRLSVATLLSALVADLVLLPALLLLRWPDRLRSRLEVTACRESPSTTS